MATKSPQELQLGDKVEIGDGKVVTIIHKSQGMVIGELLTEGGGGKGKWCHLYKCETGEVL